MIRFLGGLYLTIPLLVVTLVLVAAATFVEGQTGSHEAAAGIYHHPLFYALLSLYFVNILFSTFTRWPFKRHHVPFLLTHLGLLLIILGVAIKGFFGVQGVMRLYEGEGSHLIVFPNTYGLYGKQNEWRFSFPLEMGTSFQEGELAYTPLQIFPHGEGHWSKPSDTTYLLDGGKAGYAIEEEGKLIPVYYEVTPLEPSENPRPVLKLKVQKGDEQIEKYLLYEAEVFEPLFGALLKFQPIVAKVPNHLHLHQAKTLYRPGTTTPESYEARITVDGTPFTLLMNQVYESPEGYRYYLSNIAGKENEVKEIQLAVNYDPAKYLLTYPGGAILVLGAILLLFKKKKLKTYERSLRANRAFVSS